MELFSNLDVLMGRRSAVSKSEFGPAGARRGAESARVLHFRSHPRPQNHRPLDQGHLRTYPSPCQHHRFVQKSREKKIIC